MTHEDIQADLSLFTLDALDPDERQAIEEHLATGCAACQRELATWREVVGALALAGQEAAPPDLKPALMQRLRPDTRAPSGGKVVLLRRQPPRAPWLRTALPAAAAATLLLAAGIVHDARMRRQLTEQRQLVTDLRAELDSAHGDLQRLGRELAAKEQDVAALRSALTAAHESLAVVAAPGLRLVHLKETPQAQPAEAHVLISAETQRGLFYAFDLPPIPEDRAYELWWITEKEGPVNAGVFHPDAHGLGRLETTLPAGAGAIQAAAVTIEPAAGLPKPTGPMVLLGDVKSS